MIGPAAYGGAGQLRHDSRTRVAECLREPRPIGRLHQGLQELRQVPLKTGFDPLP
jgi:hypothetical protein